MEKKENKVSYFIVDMKGEKNDQYWKCHSNDISKLK